MASTSTSMDRKISLSWQRGRKRGKGKKTRENDAISEPIIAD